MQENYDRPRIDHVVMNGHDFEAVCTKSLECGCDLSFEHGDIARDSRVLVCADESRPGVESHARVNGGSHLFDGEIVATDGDFVDCAALLAFMPDNLCDSGRVQRVRCRRLGCAGRGRLPDQIECRLDLFCKCGSFAVSMDMHEEEAWFFEEEVIVQRNDFQTMFEQRGHHRIYFLLREHEIAHHDVFAAVSFG